MRPGGLSTPVNMPDFIDQLFEKAAQNNSGFVDASREELLDDVEQQITSQRPRQQQQQNQRVAGRNNRQRGGMDLIQAGAKWVEENIGIPLEDTIDNVFQGNQRTPEQVARDRAQRDQNMAQQLRQQKTINDLPNPAKAVLNPVLETGRVIAGGMTGAAESILNTAEIAGDTGKYFASLGRVKEDQNPFSSKYEWANWDLGRNEIGAQTGVGKVAQGFLEFGTLMAATGGFGGLSGAGASFAAAGTNLAKAGVAVKAGSIGALSGLAADMISASKGEGNLSNLIKENAPEWYPTWLTALAIDEDDSPYEVMLKTGFEGMGLGFAADALGAFLGGVRELRRLEKAGIPEEQAANQALETSKEILNNAQPAVTRDPSVPRLAEKFSSGDVSAQLKTALPNGNTVVWNFNVDKDVNTAYNIPNNIRTIEVTWKLDSEDANLQNYGRRLYTDFQKFAREELEPGTIIINSPATDSYGRGPSKAQSRRAGIDSYRQKYIESGSADTQAQRAERWDVSSDQDRLRLIRINLLDETANDNGIRARLYRRAGFGPVNNEGIQAAIVRSTPDGRGRWLRPIDLNNVDEAAQALNEEIPLLKQALQSAGDDAGRISKLNNVIEQADRGIPVTWDDAAEVVPEYFTRGSRVINGIADDVQKAYRFLTDRNPVITVDPAGNVIQSSSLVHQYRINIDGELLKEFSADDWVAFTEKNADLLSREDVAIRFSKDEDGSPIAELVRLIGDENEAAFLGRLFNVQSIEDGYYKTSIPIGGSGDFAATKGQHLTSMVGTPMPSRTVDSTTAVMQQMESRANPNGSRGGSQRTVTDAQLRRIARSIGDEPAQLLRQMVRENPVDLRELSSVSRRSVDEIVNEAATGIQEALGVAGQVDFSKILKQQVGEDELLTQAGIVQVRGLMQELTTRLYESGYNIMKMGEVNMDTYPQVVRMADELKALMRIHKESANAYSRYLSTYKIKVPILGIEIDNPVKPPSVEELAREIKNADKVLDDIVTNLASGDIEARNKAWRLANALMLADGDPSKMPTLGKYMTAITTSKGLNLLYNSLLSAPKTHIVNTMSNAMNVAYRPIAAATGGDVKVKRAAAASLYNIHQTINDAFKMAAKAMKEGAVNDGDKGLIAAAEADQQLKILQRAAEVSNDNTFKAGVGLISLLKDISDFPLFSWPSKLLTGSDEFFKTMVSRMEYNSQTMLRAIEESTGTGKPVQETFERLVKANMDLAFDPKTGQILDNNLLATAKEVTFQTDLEGWAKAFGDFINAVPPLRIFFPFVKTGHNIMVYSGTHVPYLGRYLSEYKAVMAGDDAYAKAVMRGRQAYGTMIVAAAGLAAHNGMITGNGPPDPQERKTWLLQNPARSILIGNTWVEYSRIEPFGQILSAIADVYDMFSAGRLSEDRAMYLAGYMTYAIAANLTNKSFMQGVVPLGQILTPGWQGLNTLAKLPAESINNILPLSGARRSLANLMTPYKQEFNSQFDQLVYQASAGLVKVGAPMHDWLDGSRVPSNTGGVNALNPLAMRPRNTDVVRDILEDIEFDSSIISKSLSGVKLDREHRSRMQQLMGQGSLHKELKAWVTHKDFKPAVEAFLGRLRAGERVMKENEPFYNEIVRIIERNRDLAVDQVKQEFPELQNQILDAKAIRNSQSRPGGNPKSIDFENLVNMPK